MNLNKQIMTIVLCTLAFSCTEDDGILLPGEAIGDVFVTEGLFLTDPSGYQFGTWGNPPEHPDFGAMHVPDTGSVLLPQVVFRMSQLYPNPGNSSVSIEFATAMSGFSVKAWVVRILGPEESQNSTRFYAGAEVFHDRSPVVRHLDFNYGPNPGRYVFSWDCKDDEGDIVPDGFYRIFVQLNDYILWRDYGYTTDGSLIGWERNG